MDDEEDILVKYRMRGETEWHLKKEAIMTLGKTQWGIRLKLCKQGDGHNYYSLHVAFLTKGHVARAQIKCHREGEEKTDWLQEYTFGGVQDVLVNPCLMKIENRAKEKITFIVEIKLLWNKERAFELEREIVFPNSDFALRIDEKKLMVDQGYIKRKAPLLGYLFDWEDSRTEEKKEHDLSGQNIRFQDLVDAFGTLQHHWSFDAARLLELIPIARRLGFDIWGKALNREFSQLIYKNDPVKIETFEDDSTEVFDFNDPILWTIDDVSTLTESTVASNQHVLLTTASNKRKCLCYVYTQDYHGSKYLSFGFQMTRNLLEPPPSTSTADVTTPPEDTPASESEEPEEELPTPEIPDNFPDIFDITISIQSPEGHLVCHDRIRGVKDDDYIIVGSPVFQRLQNVERYFTKDDKLIVEVSWKASSDDQNEDTVTLPGITDCSIICEHVAMKANKEYLAHHSDYFRAMFFGGFDEANMSTIELSTEDFSYFKAALEMIYNKRYIISEKSIEDYLYMARRLLFTSITEGLEFQLWSSKMDVADKLWLAEEYMLGDLEIKCQMDLKEEQLRKQRASRKRTRPADFQDEPPQAPPQPSGDDTLQNDIPIFPPPEQIPEQMSS